MLTAVVTFSVPVVMMALGVRVVKEPAREERVHSLIRAAGSAAEKFYARLA